MSLTSSDISKSNDSVIFGKPIKKGESNVRQIIDSKNNKLYQTKISKRRQDNYDFNIRFSEAEEKSITMDDETWASNYIPTLQRERKRISFTDVTDYWRLDVTYVNTITDKELNTYEVELEYLKHSNTIGKDRVTPIVTEILSAIQNSVNIMTRKTANDLLKVYATLLEQNPSSPSFIGPLPFTLTKDIFDSAKLSCGYSVTEKADGDRKLLFIGPSGHSLFISRTKGKFISYQHVGFLPELENSIFDGEYIENLNTVYLFDTLVYKGKNMRDHPLDHRLKNLNKFQGKNMSKLNIEVLIKTFYFSEQGQVIKIENGVKTEFVKDKNLYEISHDIWKNKKTFKYELDGLIYTPIMAPYFNKGIFKWKESDTIDFYVQFITKTKWQLFISGLDSKNLYTHMPFEGINEDGKSKLKKLGGEQGYEKIDNLIFNSDSDLKTGIIDVSAQNAKKFPNANVIIEFKYSRGNFIPIRYRLDKKTANNIRAVNDAWESMTKPVTISNIKTGVYRSCTRMYHNAIKNDLIKKFSSQKHVLEIGSGAGGDIAKYKKVQVKSLFGIDIVNVEYDHPKYMNFVKVNNELYNIAEMVKNKTVKIFDTINCHFALHYFFKSEATFDNFINNLNNTINKNGHFVATFMDGSKINEMLHTNKVTKGKTIHKKYNGTSIYKIKKMYKDKENINELDFFNQKIEVTLSGTKYFKSQSSTEYIINVDKFVDVLQNNNFKVVFLQSFDKMCKHFPYECSAMNPVEKEFSFMNSFIVVTKKIITYQILLLDCEVHSFYLITYYNNRQIVSLAYLNC